MASFSDTNRWAKPLTLEQLDIAIRHNSNNKTNTVELIQGFALGPLIKVTDTLTGNKYYCGGDAWGWKLEPYFFQAYPEMVPPNPTMMDPEFDLDEMELAEIMIAEMEG